MTTHKAQRSVDPVCSSLSSLRSSLRKQKVTNLDCVVKPKPLIVKTTKRNLGLKCKKKRVGKEAELHWKKTTTTTTIMYVFTQAKWPTRLVLIPVYIAWSDWYGTLVHRKLPPCISSGFPKNSLVPIYTPGWREALGDLSVLHKNTTKWPNKVSNPGLSTQCPAY